MTKFRHMVNEQSALWCLGLNCTIDLNKTSVALLSKSSRRSNLRSGIRFLFPIMELCST